MILSFVLAGVLSVAMFSGSALSQKGLANSTQTKPKMLKEIASERDVDGEAVQMAAQIFDS